MDRFYILTIPVFANSGVASILTLLHAYQLYRREREGITSQGIKPGCYPWQGDLLAIGIVANYAAVAADTFSSELGILSKSSPRLITSWNLRKVPPGTNGGVTGYGLVSGLLGSLIIVTATMALIPLCPPSTAFLRGKDTGWDFRNQVRFTIAMTLWGAFGSLLDSFLGGWLQQSVVDTRTGRIIEGEGGRKVLVSKAGKSSMHYQARADVKAVILDGEGKSSVAILPTEFEENMDIKMGATNKYDAKVKSKKPSFVNEKPSRKIESGLAILDNNEVNFLMALTMSIGSMGIASWFWGIPFSSILSV